jgi:hypothetical protein
MYGVSRERFSMPSTFFRRRALMKGARTILSGRYAMGLTEIGSKLNLGIKLFR